MRILIVEDEMLIALVAEEDLTDAGHAVVGIAASYERALALAEAERPDLALMDVRLVSGRDGIEAATELRRRFGIPSILASGSKDADNLARADAADPLEWLVKPYTTEQLLQAVARAEDRAAGRAAQVATPEAGVA